MTDQQFRILKKSEQLRKKRRTPIDLVDTRVKICFILIASVTIIARIIYEVSK